MSGDLRQGFRIGEWSVEPMRGAATGPDGYERHLEPRVMDVFLCLAEHANEVVTREKLLNSVWKQQIAADELLTGAVSDLRQALAVDGHDARVIETVPKIGYRLVGEISSLHDTNINHTNRRLLPILLILAGAAMAIAVVALLGPGRNNSLDSQMPISSLAVLTLSNASGDPEQDHFSAEMTRELIVQLTKIDSLQVRSFQSSNRFRDSALSMTEIAEVLGVDAVIEGSAQLVGSDLTITVHLIDGKTDDHIWADQFHRDLGNVIRLHSDIAIAIADAVEIILSPEQRSVLAEVRRIDPQAYLLYLDGTDLLSRLEESAFESAIVAFQQAIEIEPDFAQAHAALAATYLWLATWHGSADQKVMLPLAEVSADRALALDSDRADGHFTLAMIRRFKWEWAGADRAFQRGIELDADHAPGASEYANFLITMGRFEEAVEVARRAVVLAPNSPNALNELAFALALGGSRGEALALAHRSLNIDSDFFQTNWLLAELHMKYGDTDAAIEYLRKAEISIPDPPPSALGISGRLYALAGDSNRATDILSTLLELRRRAPHTSASAVADVYMGLGDYDSAYKWLELAFEERDVSLIWLNVDWYFGDARESDSRFDDLLDRMGIPEWEREP